MHKVLITGCGSEGARGIIQSLRKAYGENIYISGIDTDTYIANQCLLDDFWIPPRRDDADFLPFVCQKLQENNITILWPIPTMELEFFAKHKLFIEKTCPQVKVMIGSEKSIVTANSKAQLYESVQKYLPECVPSFTVVDSAKDLEAAVFNAGYPEKKVCIKKEIGAGGQGLRILDASVSRKHTLLYETKTRVCRWEDVAAALPELEPFPRYIVAEYLPGEEWDSDILCFNGKCANIVTRHALRMQDGMVAVSHIVRNKKIEEYSQKIVKELDFSYILQICFKQDYNGQYKLIEINPRVPGSIIGCLYAGINIAEDAIELLLSGKIGEDLRLPPEDMDVIISRITDTHVIHGKPVCVP